MIQKSYSLPWKPTDIYFIGDIQWAGNAQAVAVAALKQTIADALEMESQGHNVYFIGMGDYTDFASPSNRARLAAANLYDTAVDVIEQKAIGLVRELYDLALQPTRGKWLGLVEGHHLYDLKAGDTTDMRLCELLDAQFFGTSGVIRLSFRLKPSHNVPVTIWFHHGVGNGQTGYYPLNRLEKVSAVWEQVDVFAIGHTTKMATEFQNKVYPRWSPAEDLAHRKVILVGTGGYSKCYVEGNMQGRIPRGGYAEKGMMNASIIGSPVLHIRPRILEGRVRVEITAEG